MEPFVWQLIALFLIILILGGILVFLWVYGLPLLNQLKKTAQQLETTASTLDKFLNHELKALLNRGEKVLGDIEEIQPLVKEKLSYLPSKATHFAFTGMSGYMIRVLILWALKGVWGKIRRGKKGK